MRRPSFALILICALYLVHRGLVLHTDFDSVCIPNFELFPMGDIAKVGMWDWQGPPIRDFYDNCGGHLMTGLFASLLYEFMGDSYLVLKLVPVLLGLGCVILIWALGRRLFGNSAGLLAALLFVVGPPTLVKYSMLAKGNHFENVFFQLFMMWAFVCLHSSGRRWLWLNVFGLAAGFSIFFYFGSMLMVLLLVATHLAIRYEWGLSIKAAVPALKDACLLIPSFLIGISPLIWVQYGNQRPSHYIDDHLGTGSRWTQMSERLSEFTRDLLPRATCYEDLGPIPGWLVDQVYLGIFLLVWVIGLGMAAWAVRLLVISGARGRSHNEKQRFEKLSFFPLVGYFPLFVLVYAVSSYLFDPYLKPVEIGQFRYMVPHFAFASLLIAGVVHRLMEGRRILPSHLGRTIASVSMLLGLFIIPLVDWSFSNTGLGGQYAGYHWGYYKNALMRDTQIDPQTGRYTWDFDSIASYMGEFSRPEQNSIAHGVGFLLGASQLQEGRVDGELVVPAGVDFAGIREVLPLEHWQPDLLRGVGTYLRMPIYMADTSKAAVREELERLLAQADPMAEYVVEGLCIDLEFPLLHNLGQRLRLSRSFAEAIPPEYLGAYHRGLGMQLGGVLRRGWGPHLDLVKAQIGGVPVESSAQFWIGVGMGVVSDGSVPAKDSEWLELIPVEDRVHYWRGVGAGVRHAFGENLSAFDLELLGNALDSADSLALEAGGLWPSYPSPAWLGDRSE